MEFTNVILYVLIFAAYIMLFSFMFDNSNESIEGLVYILIFLLTSVSGTKLLHDLYKEQVPILDNVFKSLVSETNYLYFGIYALLFIGLIVTTVHYTKKTADESSITLFVIGIIFFILSMRIDNFTMFKSLFIPIISMILTSVNLLLLSMYNKTSIFGKIELKSKLFEKILHMIKGMFVSMVVLIIVFLGINYNYNELLFSYMVGPGMIATTEPGQVLFLNLLLIAIHIIGLTMTSYSYQVLIKNDNNKKNKLK